MFWFDLGLPDGQSEVTFEGVAVLEAQHRRLRQRRVAHLSSQHTCCKLTARMSSVNSKRIEGTRRYFVTQHHTDPCVHACVQACVHACVQVCTQRVCASVCMRVHTRIRAHVYLEVGLGSQVEVVEGHVGLGCLLMVHHCPHATHQCAHTQYKTLSHGDKRQGIISVHTPDTSVHSLSSKLSSNDVTQVGR